MGRSVEEGGARVIVMGRTATGSSPVTPEAAGSSPVHPAKQKGPVFSRDWAFLISSACTAYQVVLGWFVTFLSPAAGHARDGGCLQRDDLCRLWGR